MTHSLDNHFLKILAKRKEEGLLRELKNNRFLIDFSSNDYLGLAQSEKLFNKIHERQEYLDLKTNGSTGSRLISGHTHYIEHVEKKLAKIFKSESSLIFNSGYSANLAVLSSIPQKGDTILYDELAHASIKDGARLSLATRHSFRHNDLEDLRKKIQRSFGRIFIAVESIYSMDGDECPLMDLVAVAEEYNASIILDEAHSTGIYGAEGNGIAVSLDVYQKVDIRIYTFGKAMGIHGACVAGSANLVQYLVNFARPFIYTTTLSPHNFVSIDCAFEYLQENILLQETLHKKIQIFLEYTSNIQNRTKSQSAIQTIIVPGNTNVKNAALKLQSLGFDVRPILSPTVPKGTERFRLCLHTYNSDEEIIGLTNALHDLV